MTLDQVLNFPELQLYPLQKWVNNTYFSQVWGLRKTMYNPQKTILPVGTTDPQ